MTLSVMGIATIAMFSRYVSSSYSAFESVFYRNLIGVGLVSIIILAKGKPEYFKTKRLSLQIWRGVFGTFGAASMFYAYDLMPMAETTVILIAGGIATPILAMIFLHEHIGIYRWMAIIGGIIGGIIVVMPEDANITIWGVVVALSSSILGASTVSIFLRSLGHIDHALTTVFYLMVVGLVILLPFMIVWGELPILDTWWIISVLGILGVVNMLLKTEAYKWGEASMLAPIMYTNAIWATLYGWFIWNEWPTWNVFFGGAIIIVSNLVIIWREKIKKVKVK